MTTRFSFSSGSSASRSPSRSRFATSCDAELIAPAGVAEGDLEEEASDDDAIGVEGVDADAGAEVVLAGGVDAGAAVDASSRASPGGGPSEERSQYSLRLCFFRRLSFNSGRNCSTCSMPAFSSLVASTQLTVETFQSSPLTTTHRDAPIAMTTTPGPSRHFFPMFLRTTKTQSPRWNSLVVRCCAAPAFCNFLTVSISL